MVMPPWTLKRLGLPPHMPLHLAGQVQGQLWKLPLSGMCTIDVEHVHRMDFRSSMLSRSCTTLFTGPEGRLGIYVNAFSIMDMNSTVCPSKLDATEIQEHSSMQSPHPFPITAQQHLLLGTHAGSCS